MVVLRRVASPAAAVAALVLTFFLPAQPAHAARVTSVSPSGEVAEARQVSVRFDQAVVAGGDPRLPAPFTLQCSGRAMAGDSRWASPTQWLLDLREPLAAGASCVLQAAPGWAPQQGTLEGPHEFRFSTGAPTIVQTRPWAGGTVEEDQHFLLRLNGAIDASSLAGKAWCEIEGLGERVPLVPAGATERAAVLKAQRIGDGALWLLARCDRAFPAGASVRLVWGAGIAAAPVAGQPPLLTRTPRQFTWKVRQRFTAEFSCERERANAPCLPLRPLTLRFSAPVPRDLALATRLVPLPATAGAAAATQPIAPFVDAQDATSRGPLLSEVRFAPPLPEHSRFALTLAPNLRDDSGRPLSNAAGFPLTIAVGGLPPLAKLAAAPFGIVEAGEHALLPMTLRQVQADLAGASTSGHVHSLRLDAGATDDVLLRWFNKLQNWHEAELTARELGRPREEWSELVSETGEDGRVRQVRRERRIATRELSMLANQAGVSRQALPQLAASGGPVRATEVIGIPLPKTGYHVVEVASGVLGHALLAKPQPMYVRSGVLVTNLALHFKMGYSSSLAWVTTLDRARPVAGARVNVNDCQGRTLWSGTTDAAGLAHIPRGWDDNDRELQGRECLGSGGLFVTARARIDADGKPRGEGDEDLAFVFSRWNKGIEPWRFNVSVGGSRGGQRVAHSVLDRSLLRAGEVLSMKHFVRAEHARGLARVSAEQLPDTLVLRHEGSGEEVLQPLAWREGGRSAESRWEIPKTAKLGLYQVLLKRGSAALSSANFRVEEFRVPLVNATLAAPKGEQVAPTRLSLAAQLTLGAGGPLPRAPLKLSALLRERELEFRGYEGFNFQPPRTRNAEGRSGGEGEAEGEGNSEGNSEAARLVADRIAATTDAQGAATITLDKLPTIERASELTAEMSYTDPNGEIQTVSQRVPLWPSAVVVGIRTRDWAASRGALRWDVAVLDTAGKPLNGRELQVLARQQIHTSTRRRIVGGFYAYDNASRVQELGVVCSGKSDARGRLACEAKIEAQGEIELVVRAKDDAGRAASAAASVWVLGEAEQWFAQGNDDRIDVLPEKREVQPGETVRLQVRMPFREATALVSVEREGVLATQVLTLRGREPVVEVKVPAELAVAANAANDTPSSRSWAPNVYVSVMVQRGRLRDAPWHSFFRWGWRDPMEWWRAFRYEGQDWRAPTAMVDLAKPAYRLGVAELKVGLQQHRLEVKVTPERSSYGVRETVRTKVAVSHGGKPAAGAQVAFAAVDEGLLALRDNASWRLLEGLLRERPWGVATATAQGEVIGRRHFGRKTLPPGGDGGSNPTRELFDTLLMWRGTVQLDAQGEATIDVPLNDSLTSFRLVAVADDGDSRFGSGSASVRVTQELQLLAGLPPLVREGDQLDAVLTLRNSTPRAMKVRATLAAPSLALPEQVVELPAGAALPLRWTVQVPSGVERLAWEASAEELNPASGAKPARDRLRVAQAVRPAVPLRVWQASLQQLEGPLTLPYAPPAGALAVAGVAGAAGAAAVKQGGLEVGLQPKLATTLPGLRRYFESYPFSCIEQRSSRAIGLRDAALWAQVSAELAGHLDRDGLANYFPTRAEDAPRGSDKLTAHLVAVAHEAGWVWPQAELERMLSGLTAFVEGRTLRTFNTPRADLDVRKLAALEALARHGRASPRMLGSLALTPQQWPTAALLDWWALLRRVEGIPERAARLAEVQNLLRARLSAGGTTLRFSNEDDDRWWWLMDGPDANAARLVLAAVQVPEWKEDVPKLVMGHLGRQQGGAWNTTIANVWSVLALERFSARFEGTPVSGRTSMSFGAASAAVEWPASAASAPLRQRLPWPANATAAAPLNLQAQHQGSGKPWLSVQTLAAVPLASPLSAGYRVTRSVNAVQRAKPDVWSVGDVLRVRLEVQATADMSWVVVQDPVPSGASVLGGGLGRDSAIATQGQQREGSGWLAYEERGAEAWRAYYGWLPRGRHVVEYTLRLNSSGRFALPPTRVEAMYAPETFGEAPNTPLEVRP